MVRVNLIDPKKLSDQHLVAEYNEILMLVAYIKKYPQIKNIPPEYCLGKGHMIFFKDKLLYLKRRHESLKLEMKKRGFVPTKTIKVNSFNKNNKKNRKPKRKDINIITERIITKIKSKSNFYRYYGEHKSTRFFLQLIK